MFLRKSFLLGGMLIALLSILLFVHPVNAQIVSRLNNADSAYDLIAAVNSLRGANGLSEYAVSSILMSTAQGQAEFMAATGNVTHSGPGGISVTSRLLQAGYPLAGDLSLGGFRSENIISGTEDMSAQSAVNAWTGDAPHLNTMLSSNLTEIGAGVAVANGRVYYVIDCARPTTSGAPQPTSPSGVGGGTVLAGDAPIPAVLVSTPNQNGEVIHEVQAGQSLWQIAIAYKVKINEIKNLNNLSTDNIYPGNKLLIKKTDMTQTMTFTVTSTLAATAPPTQTTEATASPVPTPSSAVKVETNMRNSNLASIVIGVIAISILAGGFIAWRGNSKEE